MDNYKNCVCVFLSKGNGDVLSQRNAGRCVKIGSILNLLLQEGGVPAGGGVGEYAILSFIVNFRQPHFSYY